MPTVYPMDLIYCVRLENALTMGNSNINKAEVLSKAWFLGILGLLIPGSGHFVQKRFGRGMILSVSVIFCFCFGLYLGGQIVNPTVDEPGSAFVLQLLRLFANIGNGLIYVVCLLFGIGQNYEPIAAARATFEYGNHFILISGLLNYLVALDAFDIAVGRKD